MPNIITVVIAGSASDSLPPFAQRNVSDLASNDFSALLFTLCRKLHGIPSQEKGFQKIVGKNREQQFGSDWRVAKVIAENTKMNAASTPTNTELPNIAYLKELQQQYQSVKPKMGG
jgi:hypothetical protein